MAEIRKHKVSVEGFAAAVREAIGDDVRPVQPGEPQRDVEPSTSLFLQNTSTLSTFGAEDFLAVRGAQDDVVRGESVTGE